MANYVSVAHAASFITIEDGEIANGETLVIAGKTYTFQTTLSDSDGNVQLGDSPFETAQNAAAAINLDPAGAGVQYAASMTRNALVWAEAEDGSEEGDGSVGVLHIYAGVPGAQGNLIPITAGTSDATPDNATLEGGAGNLLAWLESLFALNQINSQVLQELHKLTPYGD